MKIKLIIKMMFFAFILLISSLLLEYYFLNFKCMADPVWGQLAKAQDDSETIEEAIVRLIGEHESDAGAHTGAGESLETHKTQDAIDHKAGSVLADKETMTEFSIKTMFESIDGWYTGGSVSNTDIPGLVLYIEVGAVEYSYITTAPQIPHNFNNSNFNMLFQVNCHVDVVGEDFDINLGFFPNFGTTPYGWGFVREGGNLYAHVKSGAVQNRSGILSVDMHDDHTYRVIYNALVEEFTFYIDGVLVATLDLPGIGYEDDGGPMLYIKNTADSDGNLVIGTLFFSREI